MEITIEVCICSNKDHPLHFHPKTSRCIKPESCPLTPEESERCKSEILGRYFNSQSKIFRAESINRQNFRKNKSEQEISFYREIKYQ